MLLLLPENPPTQKPSSNLVAIFNKSQLSLDILALHLSQVGLILSGEAVNRDDRQKEVLGDPRNSRWSDMDDHLVLHCVKTGS